MPSVNTRYKITIDEVPLILAPENPNTEFLLEYTDIAPQLRRDIRQMADVRQITEVIVVENGVCMKFTRISAPLTQSIQTYVESFFARGHDVVDFNAA